MKSMQMKNEPNKELAQKESELFGQETRNRADSLTPEILAYFKAESLADLSQRDLHDFCYQGNIAANSDLHKLLLLRRELSLSGMAWTPHYNF